MENIQDIKMKTISGVIWKMCERVTSQLVSFVVSVILARILLPEDYGIVAIVTLFITIADAFVNNGLGSALIQKKNADEKDFSTMFYAGIILALILYGILYFIAPFISSVYAKTDITLVLRVMGIRLPIAAMNSIQQAYVARKMIYKKFFLSTLLGTVISGIVGIIMAITGYEVWALVSQYLLNTIISTIVLFITVSWRPKLFFSVDRFKKMFSFGSKVMLSGVIGTIFDQLKSFFIGFKYTATDLAYYNRGEQIPSLLYNNINTTFEAVLFPAISKMQDNKLAVKNSLRRMIKLTSFIIVPIMFGLAVVAESLVEVILTDKWLESVPYLVIVCLQQCISVISNVNLQALKAIGRSDVLLKLEMVKKPLFLLCIIIGMQISPLAIVVANFIYGFFALIINSAPNKKLLNYSMKEQLKDVKPAILLSCIMVIGCILIQYIKMSVIVTLIMQVLTGVMIYIGLSIIFKVEEFYYILDIIRNISVLDRIWVKIKRILKKMSSYFFTSNIFKIKNNKVVFDNFCGKGYGCNPKYICEEIIRQNLDFDLVWLVNDMNEEMPKQVRKVKYNTLKAFYELATAKIWIDNVRNYKGIGKKKGQYYIQTWHGAIGLKSIEKDAASTLSESYIQEAKYDSTLTDLIITNNKAQEKYIKKYFWYDGEVACCGTPRCDIIYKQDEKIIEKVYDYFKIDKSKKIVLYVPTFRADETTDVYKFDNIKCCEVMKEKFNNEFVMLIRLHPNVSNKCNYIEYNDSIINATPYPDVQELIAASDVIISDYSSIPFEAALVYKPSFLLAKDYDGYSKSERKFIYTLEEVPFQLARTEEELYKNILNFSKQEYEEKCKEFYNKIGIVNNSESAKDIVNIIKKEMRKHE